MKLFGAAWISRHRVAICDEEPGDEADEHQTENPDLPVHTPTSYLRARLEPVTSAGRAGVRRSINRPMIVGIVKEAAPGERRVAATPDSVTKL